MKELKDRVFARLEREVDGFEPLPEGQPHPLGRDNVGLCKGKKINVRTTACEEKDRYRCDLEPGWASDFVVYACGHEDHLYVLPSSELRVMLRDAELNSKGRYSFAIRTREHTLHPTNTGEAHPLETFFEDLGRLGKLPEDLVRPPARVPAAVEAEPDRGRTPAERIRYRYHRAVELDPAVQGRVMHWLESICVGCGAGVKELDLEVHCTRERALGSRVALSIDDDFELLCPTCHTAAHTLRWSTERKK